MKMHIAVFIQGGIEALKRDENVLDCSPNEALRVYTKALAAGKKYFVGDNCDNQKPDGRCAGHEK